MNSILSKTFVRAKPEDTYRVKLMSRGQTYYRNSNPPIAEFDGKGEIIELMSRGVAYRKKVAPRIYKKPNPDAINWRWRKAFSQNLG